jgi:hypothetical protein
VYLDRLVEVAAVGQQPGGLPVAGEGGVTVLRVMCRNW